MEQVVYADVLFIINFSMDFFSLYICATVLHKKKRVLPMSVAAALGGVYAVASLFFELGIVFDMVVAFLICAVAYEPLAKDFSFFSALRSTFLFFVCEMLIGGIFTGLYNLFGSRLGEYSDAFDSAVRISERISPISFVLLAAASSAVTYIGGRIFGRHGSEKRVEIEIEKGGRTVRLCALVDSGNLLRDPISDRAVVIVAHKYIKELLPKELAGAKNIIGNFSSLCEKELRPRFVPCSSVGNDSLLVAFVPDKMVLMCKKTRRSVDAVVAIDDKTADFGGCEALVPSILLNA